VLQREADAARDVDEGEFDPSPGRGGLLDVGFALQELVALGDGFGDVEELVPVFL
jgi:hypothetical protein